MLETVQTFLAKNASAFPSPADFTLFTDYLLDPYMSIMNGYGRARLDSTVLLDIAALWDLGYASFIAPTEGYARFADGAQSWVQQMANLARIHSNETPPQRGSIPPRTRDGKTTVRLELLTQCERACGTQLRRSAQETGHEAALILPQ